MHTVRVRAKHQITLPVAIMQQANLHPNDVLEATCRNGIITLIPNRPASQRDNLMDYAGIARNSYGATPAEIDDCLADLRNEWER